MKASWKRLAARVDAISLRERAFLFISLIAVCLALADVVLITPAQNNYKQTLQRFAAQNDELARLRAELQASGQPVDTSKAVRDELAAVETDMAQTNQTIARIAPQADKGPDLEQVLVQFLRRQEGLTLLATGTLKTDAGPAASGNATGGAEMPAGLVKRGMDLRVAGSYGDLTRYVRTLETAMPTLRWGPLQLVSDRPKKPELSLQVYVVGVVP